jgi:hypothetical protein
MTANALRLRRARERRREGRGIFRLELDAVSTEALLIREGLLSPDVRHAARLRGGPAARGARAAAGAADGSVGRMNDSAPYETWRGRDVNMRTGGRSSD